MRSVHREREHRGITLEDGRRSIALMHVAVDDGNATNGALALQHADGDGHVVEHTVAFAAIAEGVVRATREIRGHAV